MSQLDRVLRSQLKLRHLQLLVALDEFRHLGRAAEFLSVTQPAASKTLADIERIYDLPLFLRSTRGTEPTPGGSVVVRFARAVLAEHQRSQQEIASIASGTAGRVNVGAMVVATPNLLVQAVNLLKHRSAQTTVLVEEGDLTRLLPRLRVGELDCIVGRLEPGYASPDLDTEALHSEPMCIVCRPDHSLLARRKIDWKILAVQPWVVPPPWASSRIKLAQMFYKHRLLPPVDIVETASFLATLSFVRERAALGFLARNVAQTCQRAKLLDIVPIAVPMTLPQVGIIQRHGRIPTPAAALLLQCLRETAASAMVA